MSVWLAFSLSAALVVFGGSRLSRYGDQIAEQTGLGGAWVGSILLAGTTSLPEVAASVMSSYAGHGNLAMGNVLGSNIFNLAIIPLVQMGAKRPILANVGPSHTMVAAAGILLSGLAALGMVIRLPGMVAGAGFDTLLLALVYVGVTRLLPRDGDPAAPDAHLARPEGNRGQAVWWKFAGAALLVIVASKFLGDSADQIAHSTGLGETFIGSTLLAITTSLPELTVTALAVWRGAYDLGVGNVLGSNIFNMLILTLSDFALPGSQPLLSMATPGQVVSALIGLVMSGIAVLGLSARNRGGRPFQWDSASIAATYIFGMWLIYTLR